MARDDEFESWQVEYHKPSGIFKCYDSNSTFRYYKVGKEVLDNYSCFPETDDCCYPNNGCVYILLGPQNVYVGQSGPRRNENSIWSRLKEHNRRTDRNFWSSVFILANVNGLSTTEICFFECELFNFFKKLHDYGKITLQNIANPPDGNPDLNTRRRLKKINKEIPIVLKMFGYDFFESEGLKIPSSKRPILESKEKSKSSRDPEVCYKNAKPETKNLYDKVEQYFLAQDGIEKRKLKQCYTFTLFNDINIGSVVINKEKLIILLKLDTTKEQFEEGFSRNLSGRGHWGSGDFEIIIRNLSEFEKAKPYINKAYNECYPYYFTYGSNLNIEQVNERCNKPQLIGTTFIENHRLAFRYNGNSTSPKKRLTIEKAQGYKVPIAVYQITSEDKIHLDNCEGVHSGCYELKLFNIKLNKKNGVRKIKAFTYVMPKGRPFAKPDAKFIEYVKRIREGYKNHNFDEKILDEAIKYSEIN